MKNRFSSLLGCLNVLTKKSGQRQSWDCNQTSALPEGICREFSFAEIKAATKNFKHKILQDNDGSVYRGSVDDGTILVAVKCLSHEFFHGLEEFRTEVQLLCQLRHSNLVSLIGFCHEQDKIIVVYEYMNRGSLASHLFHNDRVPLAWNHRLQICIGLARGLHYLHSGARRAVIHRNINSSTILLDDEWSPKLSDFGLSKLGSPSMSKTLIRMESRVMGTYGYAAPDYMALGELTEKSDVYSFGIVLFEVLRGKSVIDRTAAENQRNIIDWALEMGREGKIYDVVDPYLKGKIAPQCFNKYLEIARSCIHYEGNERPAMGEVEVRLELALELQMKADSEMEGTTTMYDESSYCTYFDLYRDYYDNEDM